MSIQFTPQFFSQPSIASASTTARGSAFAVRSDSDSTGKTTRKELSSKHDNPKRNSPFGQSSLSNASQRYYDIDWVHHESIMQDGSRIKFGAPRFSNK